MAEYERRVAVTREGMRFSANAAEVIAWLVSLGHEAALNGEGDIDVVQAYRGRAGGVVETIPAGGYAMTDEDGVIRGYARDRFEGDYRQRVARG